jgi:glycosyltransferase involved in cell wall biosynthesis
MKIGIASPININFFIDFFLDAESQNIIKNNARNVVATSVHSLIQSLLEDGNFVRIFTLSKTSFYLKGSGIEIYGIEKFEKYPINYLWGNFIEANNLKKVIESNLSDLDVLHAHWTYIFAYAASAFTDKIPVFCTVRDWAPYIWKIESPKNKITWTFKYIMNEMVFKNKKIHFISNSPYTANKIKNKYGIKTPIIPNSVKDSFLINKERITPCSLDLLCISSSNDKRKNIITLLYAFQELLKEYPEAKLSLVGSPFTRKNKEIQSWSALGLLKNVFLLGSVKHNKLKGYIDEARIFITPSLEETFGNTLLESMARKVPIIAGKYSGAIPYVLQEGNLGYLCDVSSVDDILKTIKFVYKNEVLATKKTELAFNFLRLNYLGEKVKNKHINLYKNSLRFSKTS